jgi:hypothetical protein
MGPERDPVIPLGVKHKGISSLKEHWVCSCVCPVIPGDGPTQAKYRPSMKICHRSNSVFLVSFEIYKTFLIAIGDKE